MQMIFCSGIHYIIKSRVEKEQRKNQRRKGPRTALQQFDNLEKSLYSDRQKGQTNSIRERNFMELRVLNYFLAIAREENITKAARILHISQPALSRQIMQLEEELGVKLFVRSNHSITLTEDGLLLKRRAQELLSLADKTKRDFLQKETELTGEIAIGSGEFNSTKELANIIVDFRKKHPLVQFRIYSGNSENIQDYIARGHLDLGVVGEPVDIRKYEFVSIPVRERWGVLVRDDSHLAKKEQIQAKDLLGIPLVTASRDFQGDIARWFGELYDKMEIAAVGNLLYNEAMLVESGIGAVVCIQLNCTYENLRFIPLTPAVESRTALIWKKDSIFSPATTAFIGFASQCLKVISEDRI